MSNKKRVYAYLTGENSEKAGKIIENVPSVSRYITDAIVAYEENRRIREENDRLIEIEKKLNKLIELLSQNGLSDRLVRQVSSQNTDFSSENKEKIIAHTSCAVPEKPKVPVFDSPKLSEKESFGYTANAADDEAEPYSLSKDNATLLKDILSQF